MNSRTMLAYVEIIRPLNVAITSLSIAAAASIAGGSMDQLIHIFLASIAGGILVGAGNVINDYFDVEIDRINRSNRPIPRGMISKPAALRYWVVLTLVGLSMNLFLSESALLIAIGWVVLLFLYSALFKRLLLIGNFVVAFLTGTAFIYGGVIVGHVGLAMMPAVFAFLINFARELVKDVEDREGDSAAMAKTFAVIGGEKPVLVLSTITLLILIAVTFYPYIIDVYSIDYFILVLCVDLLLVYIIVSMWKSRSPENMRKLSNLLKLNMIIGLIAIYIGS